MKDQLWTTKDACRLGTPRRSLASRRTEGAL